MLSWISVCGYSPRDGIRDVVRRKKSAENLKTVKDYADNASKVWAGVLALFVALIALKNSIR
jgi:hypothetical protein